MKKNLSLHRYQAPLELDSFCRLLESVDKEGKDWEVVLIEAGLSKNKKFYPAEVLKQALPKFENVPAYVYEFDGKMYGHLPELARESNPKGFLKNLVGWFDNIRFGEFQKDGKTKEGVLGRFHVSESASWLRKFLKDAWEHGKKTLLGFSIDARGSTSRSNGVDRVEEIVHIDEVTPVTHPAAGGGLQRLIAGIEKEEDKMDWLKKLIEMLKEASAELLEGIDESNITESQEVQMIEAFIEKADFSSAVLGEEAAPFLNATIGRIVELIKGDKVENAVKMLEDLQTKLKTYGYPKAYGTPYGQPSKYPALKYATAGVMPEAEETPEEKKKREEAEAAKKAEAEKKAAGGEPAKESESKEVKELLKKVEAIQQEAKVSGSKAVLTELLASSDLPTPVKDKIKKQFDGKIFEKAELTESLKIEKDVLAALKESVIDVPVVKLGDTEKDKIGKAMDGFFEGKDIDKVPRFTSFREACCRILGDPYAKPTSILREAIAFVPRDDRGSQQGRLIESLTTSDLAQVLGDSITRKMIKDYTESPLQEWRKVVSEITGPKDFRTQRRMLVGGYGDLPAVTEQGTYQPLTSPGDDENTYAVSKKGGLENLTLETIANDDVGLIKRIPKSLARAAIRGLYKGVFDVFRLNTATAYDGTVYFDDTVHTNLGTTALSSAGLTTVEGLMRDKTAYGNTDEVLGVVNKPVLLLIPNELKNLALRLKESDRLVSQADEATDAYRADPNPHKGIDYIVLDYWTNAKDWIALANPKETPTLEVGFYEGKEVPELFVQDMPNVGSVFTADKITYKIRFIWGVVILDHRSAYKNDVT